MGRCLGGGSCSILEAGGRGKILAPEDYADLKTFVASWFTSYKHAVTLVFMK
jgi:hypothetical protein